MVTITIGKIIIDDTHEDIKAIKACPDTDEDICNPDLTIYPRSPKRSGSNGLWDFLLHSSKELCLLYETMRDHPYLDGYEIILLTPFIREINSLPDNYPQKAYNARMRWFKYWSNKAVALYGSEAGIEFS